MPAAPIAARRLASSVRFRLILGFGLIVALLMALAALAVWQNRALGDQMERIVDGNNRLADAAHRLNAAQLDWMRELRSLLIQSDPEDLKAQLKALESARAGYMAREGELGERLEANADASEMRAQLAEVRKLREGLAPLHAQLQNTMLTGVGTDAALALLLPTEASEARWRTLITAIVDAVSEVNRAEVAAARERRRWALAVVGGIAAVAVLFALLTAVNLVRSITAPVTEAVAVAERIADGRLDAVFHARRRDEFGRLLAAMGSMQKRLRGTVRALQASVGAVQGASGEIGDGSQHLSARTEHAAAHLQRAAAAIRELADAAASSAGAAREASHVAESARADASQGEEAVGRLAAQMQRIASVSGRITEIVDIIDGIAFQTNVLALNASVEAARAGEQGRGFAVVAAEVRTLAQRAGEAAGQIRVLSAQTAESVGLGQASASDVGATVGHLAATVAAVAGKVQLISATSATQSEVLRRVEQTVQQLDEATQQNAALAEQLAAAAASMHDRAAELQQVAGSFDIGHSLDADGDEPDTSFPATTVAPAVRTT